MNKDILILGAGVSGLSTGILLLKNGYKTTIWAKDFPPDTTSNKAAAFWFPYLCNPKDKATTWAKKTLEYLKSEVVIDPTSGAAEKRIIEVFDKKVAEPWWAEAVEKYGRPAKDELPEGYVDGYAVNGVFMDTSIYLNYLVELYKKLGGTMIKKSVSDINEAFNEYDLVINCTGLGSRELFNDKLVYPVRGQTVRIKPNGFDRFIVDDEYHERLMYIIPRKNDILLGGTAQENDWNTNADPKDIEEILKRCARIAPEFKQVEIIDTPVGLRPARDVIRLEVENYSGKSVIHNYGHGGSGFTLSWGCAQEVVDLVQKM